MATDRLRFYLDEHIPSAVAQGLLRRGVDVLTAQDAGRTGSSDENQMEFAWSHGRVIVTFDDDYLVLASMGIPHAGIAFAEAERRSVGELIFALLLLHDVLTPQDMLHHVEFL